jgi:hypothetical protein
MQALDAEARCSADHQQGPRPARVEGFVDVCRRSLVDAAARPSGVVHQLVLHTTREELAAPDDSDDVGSGSVLQTARGTTVRVHPASARRMTCDCPATEVIDGADGAALHVGRRSRRIRGRLRRAGEARDRGRCRGPGCTAPAAGAHHLRHWANGGDTCLRNLVSLCERHHWLVHEGGFQIAIPEPGRWVFLAPDGRRVPATPPTPAEPTSLPYDDDIAADAVTGHWSGQRLDLDLALASLATPPRPASQPSAGAGSKCSAEHPAPTGFQFDQATINAWADDVERMVREARPQDVIYVDD